MNKRVNLTLNNQRFFALLLLLSLAGCVSTARNTDDRIIDTRITVPEQEIQTLPKPDNPAFVNNAAINHLLAKATKLSEQLRYDSAIQELERGLSIAPNNPFLWQKIAEVRLQQGRYAQAEQLANKSNALGRGDSELLEKNGQIIEAAKKARELQ